MSRVLKRQPVNKKRSAKQFQQDSQRTHRRNMAPEPMRGGIRL